MNSLHIFALGAMMPRPTAAVAAAALKIRQAGATGSLSHSMLSSKGRALDAVLLVLLPLSLIAVLYIIAEMLYGPNWWKSSAQDDLEKDLQHAPSAGKIPQPQFQRGGRSPEASAAPPASSPTSSTTMEAAPVPAVQAEPSPGERLLAPRPVQTSKPRPGSAGLIVTSPEGVILQFDGTLAPQAEHRTVRLRSVRGANEIIRARADELSGDMRVFVESASGVPLVVLDTKAAGGDRPRSERRVLIHRIAGSSWTMIGPPLALVRPVAPRQFTVHNVDQEESVILKASVCADSSFIDHVVDGHGSVVVRNPSEGMSENMIWVVKGADMALIASVVLAVQKLA